MRVRGKARLYAVGTAVAAFALSACARANLPQNTLAPQGPEAEKIDRLFQPVFWIAVGVFVLVEGALVYFSLRYRHRPGRGVPVQVHGNKRLEITWTVIPAVLLAAIAVPTIGTIFGLARVPPDAMRIQVTGHQWWWEVHYPPQASRGVTKDVVTANEIHIPTGIPIEIQLTSKDVIHSFWIPRLAGKQDLEPNHRTHLTLEAPNPGTYFGQCAEFCGLSHANMRMRVIAQTPADFQGWVQQQLQPAQPPPPDVLAIMQRAGVSCNGCHTIDGVEGFAGTVGPNLTHFAARSAFAGDTFVRNDDNLAKWLHDAPGMKPGADMPNFSQQLSAADVDALVAYLDGLK